MKENEKKVCNSALESLGEKRLNELNDMEGSENFTLAKCVKEIMYDRIIKLHRDGETYKEIVKQTGEQNRQVSRVIEKYNLEKKEDPIE